jgi:anti-sigma factor RsiW
VTHFDIHRGGLTPDTPCPTDLDLARFVEGSLQPDARTLMVAHLAECDDCREVVATVVAAQDVEPVTAPAPPVPAPRATVAAPVTSFWLRGPTWAAAVAVAALAVVTVHVVTRPDAPAGIADTSAWTELAQVVGPARAIEARLSGLPCSPRCPPARQRAPTCWPIWPPRMRNWPK